MLNNQEFYMMINRAQGVLVGAAVGDALGAGYEFTYPDPSLVPQMIGGGLGNFEPGEWTDDTDQTIAVADIASKWYDLGRHEGALLVAENLMAWYRQGPADIGIQTQRILGSASKYSIEDIFDISRAYSQATSLSSGNGSLMRTSPVALATLSSPWATVRAASLISRLTHNDLRAQQACVLWSLMIRHTILFGVYPQMENVLPYMTDKAFWISAWKEAEDNPPHIFKNNAWSVGAFQAAWSAITHSSGFSEGLYTAIRIGHDTDTVASIAGSLLGARYGVDAIDKDWVKSIHGYPGYDATSLMYMAEKIVKGGSQQEQVL